MTTDSTKSGGIGLFVKAWITTSVVTFVGHVVGAFLGAPDWIVSALAVGAIVIFMSGGLVTLWRADFEG